MEVQESSWRHGLNPLEQCQCSATLWPKEGTETPAQALHHQHHSKE